MSCCSRLVFAVTLALFSTAAIAQETAAVSPHTPVVPHLVRYAGALPEVVAGNTAEVRFAVYASQTGGEPLWAEVQHVAPDTAGRYSVLLGSITPLPDAVFAAGEARWVGVVVDGREEAARTPLAAAAYALKAEDAQTLGGHPASDFALTSALKAKPGTATPVTQINTSNGVLGGGTGPTVSLTLDTTYLENLGNSLYPLKSAVVSSLTGTSGVIVTKNGTAYNATIDGGYLLGLGNAYYSQLATANTFGGTQTLKPSGTATTSAGSPSYTQRFAASVYSTTAKQPVQVYLGWLAEPQANNTLNPSASLNLVYNSGSNTPAQTGFSIAANGLVTFASGQNFPGAGTITGVTAGSGLTGGGTTGNVSLAVSTSALETTFDKRYAQLGAADTYTSPQAISSTETISGTAAGSLSGSSYSGQLTVTDTSASGGIAIAANATSPAGIGIVASGDVDGVVGYGSSTDTANSIGPATGVFGLGKVGVFGKSTYTGSSSSGAGVYGLVDSDYAGTGTAPAAVYAMNAFTSGAGVSGSGPDYGVYGGSTTLGSFGVYGYSSNNNSTALKGLIFDPAAITQSDSSNGLGAAIWADSSSPYEFGEVLFASADDNNAAYMINNSTEHATLHLQNYGSGGTQDPAAAPVMTAVGRTGACSIGSAGDMVCSGRLKTAVDAGDSRSVEMYAVQSPENWFEDFGSARLESGVAHVMLEPQFARLVNTGVEYHVFLTPKGDSDGLFIADENAAGFEVREQHHGTASIAFDYRIVAKRNGHEAERMADATDTVRMMYQTKPEASPAARAAAMKIRVPPSVRAPVLPAPPARQSKTKEALALAR